MVGFCRLEENPFGPVQLYDAAPAAEALSCSVPPAQSGPLFDTVGAMLQRSSVTVRYGLKLLPGAKSLHVAGGVPPPRKNCPERIGDSASKLRFAFVAFVCSMPTKKLPGPTATGAGSVIVCAPATATVRFAASA